MFLFFFFFSYLFLVARCLISFIYMSDVLVFAIISPNEYLFLLRCFNRSVFARSRFFFFHLAPTR